MKKIVSHSFKPDDTIVKKEFSDWLKYLKTFFSVYKASPVLFVKNNDSRPFLQFSVKNQTFSGLLDSGANSCILGSNSHVQFLNLGYKMERIPHSVHDSAYTADGSAQKVIGAINLPITCDNITKIVKFMIIPLFDYEFILGFDFWIKFDLAKDLWKNIIYINEDKINSCSVTSAAELSPSEKQQLNKIISLFEDIS